jgi:hypothetical protein
VRAVHFHAAAAALPAPQSGIETHTWMTQRNFLSHSLYVRDINLAQCVTNLEKIRCEARLEFGPNGFTIAKPFSPG